MAAGSVFLAGLAAMFGLIVLALAWARRSLNPRLVRTLGILALGVSLTPSFPLAALASGYPPRFNSQAWFLIPCAAAPIVIAVAAAVVSWR